MTGSSPATKRWLGPAALALFLGGPCLLLALTIANTARWSQAAEAAEERAAQLSRIEMRIRGLAAAPAGGVAEQAALFLAAKAPSLARAELQTRLSDLVGQAGARLVEMQIEEEPATVDPGSLLARVTFEARNPGFLDLLAAIETGRPLLTVERLDVRPAQARNASEEDPMLRVALAVRGYRAEDRP